MRSSGGLTNSHTALTKILTRIFCSLKARSFEAFKKNNDLDCRYGI